MPVDDTQADAVPDAGAMLRAARDAAGLSVPQVAQRLKLTTRMVEAIEASDRRGFPAMAYLRGYTRSYARLLGIDPEPLLEAYAREAPEPSEPMMVQPGQVGNAFPRIPVAMIGGGLLALAVLLLIVWQWPVDEGSAGPVGDTRPSAGVDATLAGENLTVPTANDVVREASAGESSPDAVVADETVVGEQVHFPGLGSNGENSDRTDPDAIAADGVVRSLAPPDVATDVESVDQSAAATAGFPIASPSTPATTNGGAAVVDSGYEDSRVAGDLLRVRRITPVGDDELWFEFTEDCWVEVFNTEGQTLYEDLLSRRQSLRLVGSPPFQIRLGYAPGATLEYNGEPVPLGPHTRNNVASLVLGQ